MSRARTHDDPGSTPSRAANGASGVPGKRTLTEQLPVPGRKPPAIAGLAPGKRTLTEQLLCDHGEGGRRSSAVQLTPKAGTDAAHAAFNRHEDVELSTAERTGIRIPAPAYLHLHMAEVRHRIHDFLAGRPITAGDPQVRFVDGLGPFLAATLQPLEGDDTARHVQLLRDWVAPADLFAIVDRNRAIRISRQAFPRAQGRGPRVPSASRGAASAD